MTKKNETLGGDILVGAKAISDFIEVLDERQVYHQQKGLALQHLGGLLIGSKREITKRLTGRDE
jgi:hypothetical protein